MIDPTGMTADGWIENDITGEITWDECAESQETTPLGYTYRGLETEKVQANGMMKLYQSDGTSYISGIAIPEVVIIRGSKSFEYFRPSYDPTVANPFSPNCSSTPALVLAGAFAAPILIPMAINAAGGLTTEAILTGVTGTAINTLSQGIANGGDFRQVNLIEAGASAFPGVGPTIVGETFNLPVSSVLQGDYVPSMPTSFEKAVLQIGGGVISNQFGTRLDRGLNRFNPSIAGKVYGEMAKFSVETGSNTLPLLGN